ncbi:integrase, catalytic region, zinc finger, CCHC-type containing protein, partial [Tanacetum coccineum]
LPETMRAPPSLSGKSPENESLASFPLQLISGDMSPEIGFPATSHPGKPGNVTGDCDIGILECLEELYLWSVSIKNLPDSICMLKHLKSLEIRCCILLEKLLEDIGQLECLERPRVLHSNLKLLSNNDLKRTRTECGFKRAFATLFGQDVETFTSTMFLNVDQLEKQLDNGEFQEIGSMTAFKVLETQFQMFIKSQIYLDDEYVVMTRNYFLQYTQLEIPEFHDTLMQHMESVKNSIDKRAQHKREYDIRVKERQMQTTDEKVDSIKALDTSLVNTESSGTESKEQDTSSRSGNDAHADDVDIRPIYDEAPMAEVQTTTEINVFATGQKHTEQPKFNNEGEVDQNAEQCHELLNQSLESKNICLKQTVAQFQKDFLRNGSTLC